MLYNLGILTGHIAIGQLVRIKNQVTGVHLIQKDKKNNKTYMEIGSKCAIFYISYTTVNISNELDPVSGYMELLCI